MLVQLPSHIYSNFPRQVREGELGNEQLRGLLVFANIAKGDSSGAVAVGLLHAAAGKGLLASGLGGGLLASGLGGELLARYVRQPTSC